MLIKSQLEIAVEFAAGLVQVGDVKQLDGALEYTMHSPKMKAVRF
jgi:hypothetical protein